MKLRRVPDHPSQLAIFHVLDCLISQFIDQRLFSLVARNELQVGDFIREFRHDMEGFRISYRERLRRRASLIEFEISVSG